MERKIKFILRGVFLILFIACAFCVINTHADEQKFEITNLEVIDKSEGVTIDDVSLDDGIINSEITFAKINDYIKYAITIKNVSDDVYIIKSIENNNENNNLEYTYSDLSNVRLDKGEEKTIELNVQYVKTLPRITINDKSFSLLLSYEKEVKEEGIVKGVEEILNPETKDKIAIIVLIGVISLIGFISTIVSRKKVTKTMVVLLLIVAVASPFITNAEEGTFAITFNTNTIHNTYSKLVPGIQFNYKTSRFSYSVKITGSQESKWGIWWSGNNNTTYYDETTRSITRATKEQYEEVKDTLTDEKNLVSTEDSHKPIYIWYVKPEDNPRYKDIYLYCEDEIIALNEDSSYMFGRKYSLKNLDLSYFTSELVTDMSNMFYYACQLNSLGISHFDTSNVTDMYGMFFVMSSLKSLDLGENFDTSNVTNMNEMFDNMGSLTELTLPDKFDTSKVTNMYRMFAFDDSLITLDLGSKFVVSSGTSCNEMFKQNRSLNLTTIYATSVTDFSNCTGTAFQGASKLVGGAGTPFNYSNGNAYGRIDDPENGRPGYFTARS